MSRARRNILLACLFGVVLMVGMPPFEAAFEGAERTWEIFIRYDVLVDPPSQAEGYAALFGTEGSAGVAPDAVQVRIDAQRLLTQLVALGIIGGVLVLMAPAKP